MSPARLVRCLVIEIYATEQEAAVLTDDGVYAMVPLAAIPSPDREPGAVARLPHPDVYPDAQFGNESTAGSGAGRVSSWLRMTAAAAALVLAMWGGSSAYSIWAYPYELAIDMNPSLTLTLDQSLNVHRVVPQNDAAEAFAAEHDLKGLSAVESVQTIMAWSADQRRSAGESVGAVRVAVHQRSLPLIPLQPGRQLPEHLHAQRLADTLNFEHPLRQEVYVMVQQLDLQEWRSASRAGVSPNDWALGLREARPSERQEVLDRIREARDNLQRDGADPRRYIRTIQPPDRPQEEPGAEVEREDGEGVNDDRIDDGENGIRDDDGNSGNDRDDTGDEERDDTGVAGRDDTGDEERDGDGDANPVS